jgi:hypothetical protein
MLFPSIEGEKMQTISSNMQAMITSGRYTNPAARLICDIDPPFVGLNTLLENASSPYFYEYSNTLYMSVVTSTGIVIYSINLTTKALTQVASITASNVQNARFCYDGSLFYAVWENSADGKIYYYNGADTAELVTGICPDILYDSAVYLFWVGTDGIYQKTGSTTSLLIEQTEGETFKGLKIFLMPDGKLLICCTVETSEQDEIRLYIEEESIGYVCDEGTSFPSGYQQITTLYGTEHETTSISNVSYAYKYGNNTKGYYCNLANTDNILTESQVSSPDGWNGARVYAGDNTFLFTRNQAKGEWAYYFGFAGNTLSVYILNFKLIFEDDTECTLQESIENEYISPLVLISSSEGSLSHVWTSILNIYDGGNSGTASVPRLDMCLKATTKEIKGVKFYSNKDWVYESYDRFLVAGFGQSQLSLSPMIVSIYDYETKTIHTAGKGTLDQLQGSFSGNSIYLSWYQNRVVYGRALYESEMYDNEEFVGSNYLGRWTGATQFCSGFGDDLPVMHVANSEVDLVAWKRNGNLVYGPKVLDNPMSADCTLFRSMESGDFNADFANDGEFVIGDLTELFENEKKIGFEIGYNSEFIRKATGQADSDTVKRTESNIITISAKNKFYNLMQATITRNYSKTFTIGEKTTIITGYALTGSIPADGTVEVRIENINGKRWIPDSMEIANLTSGFTAITEVYGQTEFFGFIRIRNDSELPGTPSFDVLAEDCTTIARKVGSKGEIENEEVELNETTPVALAQKSIDDSQVANVVVKNSDDEAYDYTEDSEQSDYALDVNGGGYTIVARTANSSIADGETVYIDYDYITQTTFSMTFNESKNEEDVLTFLQLSASDSYQVKVLSVTGMTVEQYYANYRPLHIFSAAAVNGCLVQFVLNQNFTGTITYEIWARPTESEQEFGIYPTPESIFKDLSKRALYKDVKFLDYDGSLEEGQFTSYNKYDLFFSIEEGFDPDTLRIENTSTKGDVSAVSQDVNISIIEAGYIVDNDGYQNWGVRLSVTRAAYSGASLNYSFQIWGQYIARYDFLPPFNLNVSNLPQTNLTEPLRVVDVTIEEAARKALQVCFANGRPFDMFINYLGEWTIKLVKSETFQNAAHTFQSVNMGSITQKRQTPLVLDRVEVEGSATESYLITYEPERIDTIGVHLPAKTHLEGYKVDFKKMYDPDSIYFFFTARWKCNVYIIERASSYCKIDFLNRTGNVDSYANATIEVWGTPVSSVNYQQLYTAKTNPGAGGKYRLNTAKVQNELITDPITAGQVADQIIIESCQDAIVFTPETCPANPALEPMDTCIVSFSELGSDVKALVEELTYKFETDDSKPTLTMDTELIPRKPWAAGFVSKDLTFDGDQEIQDIVIGIKYKATDFLNILFG